RFAVPRAGKLYSPIAEWPKTTSPEVPGKYFRLIADERPPACPAAPAGRHQRLLCRGRVRAGQEQARQDRAVGRRRRERRRALLRAAGQDGGVVFGRSGRDQKGLDRDRLPRRAVVAEAAGTGLRRPL